MSGVLVDPKTVTSEVGSSGQLGALVTTGYPSSGTSQSVLPVPPGLSTAGSGFIPPATKTVYVDGNRTDTYTPDGSILKPFLHIQDAVNKVSANGDNTGQLQYLIIIAPAVYFETVDLSNSKLVNLYFIGYGAVVQNNSQSTIQAINNDNLTDCVFIGFQLSTIAGAVHLVNLSSATNGTNFGLGSGNSQGILFIDCFFNPGGTPDIFISNCGGVVFDRCVIAATVNATNCIQCNFKGGIGLAQGSSLNLTTNLAAPTPANFSATQSQIQNTASLATITIDSASSLIASMGSRIRGNVTLSGAFTNRSSHVSSTITVNNGGVYKEDGGGGHTGTLTINAGGSYQQTGVYGTGGLELGAAAPVAPSGSLALGSGTAASATAGAATLPTNPVGFLVFNLGGTTIKVPYYNS